MSSSLGRYGVRGKSWTTGAVALVAAWTPCMTAMKRRGTPARRSASGWASRTPGWGMASRSWPGRWRFDDDGGVEVRHCWTEMGQGIHTVALQVAVEELGVAAERVRVVVDTTRELGAGQTTGSRGTLMGAGAVAEACREAIADGCRTGIDYE